MASIIDSSVDSISGGKAYSIWRIALVGLALGVIYWGLTAFIFRYSNSIDIASNVATIVVATLGIIAMLYLRMAQPILVSIATAVSLWGLACLTNGLSWIEIIFWDALLYGLSYTLFLWISRYKKITPVLIMIIAIVIILRLTINL